FSINSESEIRRRQIVLSSGVAETLESHRSLHAIVPERLLPVQPRRGDHAEFRCQRTVGGGEGGIRVLQPERQGSVGRPEDVRGHARGYAGWELAYDVDVGSSQIKVVEMTVRDRVPLELIAILPVDKRAYGDRRRLTPRDSRGERAGQRAEEGHRTTH